MERCYVSYLLFFGIERVIVPPSHVTVLASGVILHTLAEVDKSSESTQLNTSLS